MGGYLAGITLFGLRFRRHQRSLRDYFLAEQQVPWWAIALSIVAAETSTLTIISIPGLAYDTNLGFLQLVFGYLLGRIVISVVFIPRYFQGKFVTAYELLQQRFGGRLRRLAAGLFLLTRAAAEGVRVFAISIVVGIALGINEVAAVAVITVLTLIYTFEGGMAAVIWTDVVQMAIYMGGTLVGFLSLLHRVPGGWAALHASAAAAGKLQLLDFSPNLFHTYTFWSGIIGGTFLTTASHGTDQLLVQRLLAARSRRQSQAALLASGVAILFQFALFLLVGIGLWGYYRQFPPGTPFARSDRIFPTFIVQQMPRGISGLLIAAILAAAMSNLSAALNSLAASSVVDFHAPLRPAKTDRQWIRWSRIYTVLWALMLFALALLSRRGGRMVEVGLSIASVGWGAMLGVFLLSLAPRRREGGAMIGMLCGLAFNLYLWRWTALPFTWYVAFGSVVTFVIGYIASMLFPSPKEPLDA